MTLRRVETIAILLVGLLLAVATVNDVVRQTHINDRLRADESTWRHYTGHAYHNLQPDQELLKPQTSHEVVCGNTSPGAPRARVQECLMIWGPVRGGLREVHGGWKLPPGSEDQKRDRFSCFGAASEEGRCPASTAKGKG